MDQINLTNKAIYLIAKLEEVLGKIVSEQDHLIDNLSLTNLSNFDDILSDFKNEIIEIKRELIK